jgi:hypothetical protein
MSHADRWLGTTLVLMAMAWLSMVHTLIPDAGAEWPGPRGFPLLLGVVLAVLGLILLVAPARPNATPSRRTPNPGSGETGVAAGTFALLILYAFLLERAGFLIATFIIIALTMTAVLRIRRWFFIGGFAAAFSVGCWLVFSMLLGIPLPRGVWIAW